MIVPSITPTWRYAARGAKSSPAPQAATATSPVADHRERGLTPLSNGAAEDVVDDPGERDATDAQRDRLPLLQVGDARIHEPDARIEVVEDDEEREARRARSYTPPT